MFLSDLLFYAFNLHSLVYKKLDILTTVKHLNHHIIDYVNIQKNTDFDTGLVKKILPLYFDEPVEFARLYGGFRNTTALITANNAKYVLRIYSERANHHESDGVFIKAEWDFITFLEKRGLPVPRLHPSKSGGLIAKSDNYYAVLMAYIDGKDGRFSLNNNKFENLGKLFARMHLSSTEYSKEKTLLLATKNPFEHLKEKIKPEDVELAALFDPLYQEYTNSVAKIESIPAYLIHGDLIFSNILFDGDDIAGVLDFGDIHRGIFIKELAKFVTSAYDHHDLYKMPVNFIDSFMLGYTTLRELSSLEKEFLPIYLELSRVGIFRMLKKHRSHLVDGYVAETKVAIDLIKNKYL